METYRILIVEDDQKQINWAKQCLSEHKLTFAESEEEFYSLLLRHNGQEDDLLNFENFDFVITDMNLPVKKGETPSLEIGKGIFEVLIRYTFRFEKLKGCAIVSNYEHHLINDPKMALVMQYWERNKGVSYCYTHDSYSDEGEFLEQEEREFNIASQGFMNSKAIVLCDMCFLFEKSVISNKGEIIQNADNAYELVRNGEYQFLKPYMKLVDSLIKSQ